MSDFCSTLTWWASGPSGPFSEPTSCPCPTTGASTPVGNGGRGALNPKLPTCSVLELRNPRIAKVRWFDLGLGHPETPKPLK